MNEVRHLERASAPQHHLPFLSGGGETGALIRAHDWAATPLGAAESWPSALRTAVSLMLTSAGPVYIAWGRKLTSLYNDGYLPIVGTKHPGIGLPYSELWADIWAEFEPIVAKTLRGEAQHFVDLPIPLAGRPGRPVGWFTFSYTPLRDDDGAINGFYCAATETTERVLADARQRFLLDLADETRRIANPDAILSAATCALSERLGATRVVYADVSEARRLLTLRAERTEAGAVPLPSELRLDEFALLLPSLRAGETLRVPDALSHPQCAAVRDALKTIGAAAFVCVPLLKDGRLVASLNVHQRSPREWTDDEVVLIEAVAERTWEALERARAEAEQRQSEGRFQALINATENIVFGMSPDWREMRALDGVGFVANTEQPLTDWVETYIPPEEQSRFRVAIEQAILTGAAFDLEHRVRRVDGTVGWMQSRAIPIRNTAGDIVEWFGAARDVTARVTADQSFRRLFAASLAPFLVLAPDPPRFTITDVNDAYLAATMRTREDLVGRALFDAFPDNSEDPAANGVSSLRASLERTLASRQPETMPALKYDIVRPDGRYEERWWQPRNSPVLGDNGEVERIIHHATDITEQRRVEKALRESEARLRELNETLEAQVALRSAERDRLWNLSQDMLARAGYDGMMSAVSPAWGEVLGWSETELLTRPYSTFMHPEDMPVTLAALARMGETGEPARFENRIATKDGGYKPIEWTVTPEPDGVNFIAVGRDLSITKARETELETTREALRQAQKMEAVGQLTGGIAHDFNNMLQGVAGGLDLARRRIKEGRADEVIRYLEASREAASRAAMLTRRLLAFARRQPLDARPVELNALVEGMAELVRRAVGPQVEVELRIGEGSRPVLCDANQMESALLNLAINARDAMPGGGRLTIVTRDIRLGPTNLDGHEEMRPGDYVEVAVIDTGAGMPAEIMARAFEPFYTTKPVGRGTGLGLSQVYGFMRQSGGLARLESTPGRGTTVRLVLPRHTGPAPSARPEQPAHEPAMSDAMDGCVVLLVEDEVSVRAQAAEALGEVGCRVVEAADGAAALALLRAGASPDLLVTDVGLPGVLNGRQVAEAVREMRPGLPVLFITGYAGTALGDALPDGMSVISKPFALDALVALVCRMLAGQRLHGNGGEASTSEAPHFARTRCSAT